MSKTELGHASYYLKLSIHDNDFGDVIELVADMLYDMFYFLDTTSDDIVNNLPQIKNCVKEMLYEIHRMFNLFGHGSPVAKDYFEPDLKIVEYMDIPEWDNGESAFVPLFEGDIIYK